jgi:hypothetical protein
MGLIGAMGGYPAFAGHPWHPMPAGFVSLLALVFPFLVLALLFSLLAAARWGRRRASALFDMRKPPAASLRALPKSTYAMHPMLASDLEREEAASVVSQAVGEGCLSFEEGEHRIDAVLRSRHRHELADIVADLPSRTPVPVARPLRSAPLRRGLLAVAAAVVLAAALVQALAGIWELWPVAVVALGWSALLPRR